MSHTDDLTATTTVDRTPAEVFAALIDVRGWWSRNIIGDTTAVGDEFVFTDDSSYAGEAARTKSGISFCRFLITEVVPGERMVWHVVDGRIDFIADHDEWTGTDVVIEITPTADGTTVRLTHRGLTATASECFEACSRGWAFYVTTSLPQLITSGTGRPIPAYAA